MTISAPRDTTDYRRHQGQSSRRAYELLTGRAEHVDLADLTPAPKGTWGKFEYLQ
jgi:hypothetical protein